MQQFVAFVIGVFITFLQKTVVSNSDIANENNLGLRLPRNLKPKLYKLEIKPYLDPINNFTFDGKVSILFDCIEDTETIVLHSKNLTIFENKVTLNHEKNKDSIPIKQHEFDTEKSFYIIHPGFLKSGESYEITIEFKGELGNQLIGLYRGSYDDKQSKEKRWFAVTQFEPIYARQCFPCFDEPDFKAQFDVSITRRTNMTSLSNMPLKSTTDAPEDGWVTDHFDTTVPMSTYLVAFVVSDFEHLDSPDGKLRVWSRKDFLEDTKYALEIGPKILKHFEEYFGLKFPLPKQDFVALPDFYHGAMENFGLITFREYAVLYHPNKTSDASQDYIANTISHELSHQWFGNLVTMKWFNDLWLNEGFATYVSYIGVDKVEPAWHVMENFIIDEMQPVLAFDAWNSSHSISVDVENPDDIDELFDSISYKKGASIIRMMANFLTDSTMRVGLSKYLNKWKFNNTDEDDLWEALTKQAHEDKTLAENVAVKEICDTWTKQKGYPFVNVQRFYDQKNKTVIFTQEQFTFSKSMNNEQSSPTWWIPISYATPAHDPEFNKTQPEFWLTSKDKTLQVEIDINSEQWLILNVRRTGFYRVNYDTQNWLLIKSQLDKDFRAIHKLNRAQIINDIFNLARNSLTSYDLAFDVTNYIRNDDEQIPWESYFGVTSYFSNILGTTPVYGKFKAYLRNQLEAQYEIFGFEGKEGVTVHQRLHRANIISAACGYGVQRCVDVAKKKFAMWMNSSNLNSENSIRKNFRGSVYCIALREGGEKEWDFLWERYLAASTSDKSTILSALSCSREPWILNRLIEKTIIPVDKGGISQESINSVLRSVANSVIGSKIVLQFLDDYWEQLFQRSGKPGLQGLDHVLESISARLHSPSELRQFEVFKERDFGPAKLAVNQGLERIKTNMQWMKTHYSSISTWLTRMNQKVNK